MNSKIFKLDWRDMVKGGVTVMLSALFAYLMANVGNFTFTADATLNDLIILSISTLAGYLSKNLATDENGKLGGVI